MPLIEPITPRKNAPRIARREVMMVSAGAAAAGLLQTAATAAAAESPLPGRAELFAFPAPDADAAVFAVTFPISSTKGRAPTATIRIHAGSRIWTVRDTGAPIVMASAEAGALVYGGRITQLSEPHRLVVVVAPVISLPEGQLPIWAELSDERRGRLRIGNPIVAELLARDPQLARVFHKAHPANDRALFTEALVERLAAHGAAWGALEPRLHAERLANLLLPDVLPFDPSRPVGFTFAGQNGRRPSDQVADIANSVLAGVVATAGSAAPAFQPADAFPYFQTFA
jgi:hypothetical protein